MEEIKDILINPESSIKQALKLMDSAGKRILFVIDEKKTILGTITDGDIRRWILKGKSLNLNVVKVMNRSPVVLRNDYLKDEAQELMISQGVDCLPVVDENKRVTSLVWWLDLFGNKLKKHKSIDLPVVIMAGGEGNRLSPFTNILPKPLIPIGDKPIIELIIDKFADYGCKKFYLSVNYKANMLKSYFSDCKSNYDLEYIQEDKPLGTIGSLHLLKNKIKKTFFVSNCDILIEADYADILKFHHMHKNSITLIVSMKHYTIPYGICKIKNGGVLKGIEEKPEYDFLVNTGLCLMDQKVLKDIPDNAFYNMTDLIEKYIKKDKKIGIYPVSDKSWLDMGQWEELQNTLQRFNIK